MKAASPNVFVGTEKLVIVGVGTWLIQVFEFENIVSLLNARVWSVFISDLYNAVSPVAVKLVVQNNAGINPINVTVNRLLQLVKAEVLILVTEDGIVTLVKFMHCENAFVPIIDTVFGIMYEVFINPGGYKTNRTLFLLNKIPFTDE